MKHNFILRKDNEKLFKQRFEKLLNKTECLVVQGVYKGARKIAHITKGFYFSTITKTSPAYLLKEKIQYDYWNFRDQKGLMIRIHKDAVITILYGQKIKFTPNRIFLIGEAGKMDFYRVYGKITTFQPFDNMKIAKSRVAMEEQSADDYWDNYEAELMEEMKNETFLEN